MAGLTFVGLVIWGLLSGRWLPLLLASYGLAWLAHFFLERNTPATWTYARWSLRAEYKMLLLALTGRLRGEYVRHFGKPDPGPDDPLLTDR